MGLKVVGELPCRLNTRTPSIPVCAIAGLWIHDVLMSAVYIQKSGGSPGAFTDRLIEFPTNSVVKREAVAYLPGVLHIDIDVASADGCRANVLSAREVRRCNRHSIGEWAPDQEAGERVGQEVACIEIVRLVLRRSYNWDVLLGLRGHMRPLLQSRIRHWD